MVFFYNFSKSHIDLVGFSYELYFVNIFKKNIKTTKKFKNKNNFYNFSKIYILK